MSHPQIPPKSKFFMYDMEGWNFMIDPVGRWIDGNKPCYVMLEMFPLEWAPYIACVAEVEWRKRADQWHELWSRVADRYLMSRNGTSRWHRQTLQYQLDRAVKQQQRCHEIADAWRAWGTKDGIWDAALAEKSNGH